MHHHCHVSVPLGNVPRLVPISLRQPGKGSVAKLARVRILLASLMQLVMLLQQFPPPGGESFPTDGTPQWIVLAVCQLVSAFVRQLREGPRAVSTGVGLLLGVHPQVVLKAVLPLEATGT